MTSHSYPRKRRPTTRSSSGFFRPVCERLEDRSLMATLYGATGGELNSDLYMVDAATGATTSIGPIGFAVTGLAVDPNSGTLYGSTSLQSPNSPNSIITIDKTTGAGTLVGPVGISGEEVADLTFDASGTLYGWTEIFTDDLVTINTSTGAATPVGNSGIVTFGSGLADVGGTLYYSGDGVTGELRTVNKATGVTTVVTTLHGAPSNTDGIAAMAVDPDSGVLFAVALNDSDVINPAYLVTINTVTGEVTTIGALPNDFDAIAFDSVQNTPPDAGVSGPSTGVRGQPLTYQIIATDAEIADLDVGLSVVVNWGDGSPTESFTVYSSTPQPLSLVHSFVASQTYTITVTATDQHGGTDTATQTVSITAVAIQDDPLYGGKMLVVGGTLGNDKIVLNPSHGMKVQINGKSQGNFTPTSRAVVYGQDGNDNIQVAGAVRLPVWLYGGNGNDRLKGAKGNDFLFGGAGHDNLLGGQGNDLLVGDLGADRLVGEAGNDVLIAGSSSATLADTAIKDLVDAWARSAKSVTDNDNLKTGLGVTEDSDPDKLTGAAGIDSFLYQAGVDVATDLDHLGPTKPKPKKK
jgi:Ca2+-binding RTX toxin-like protein